MVLRVERCAIARDVISVVEPFSGIHFMNGISKSFVSYSALRVILQHGCMYH